MWIATKQERKKKKNPNPKRARKRRQRQSVSLIAFGDAKTTATAIDQRPASSPGCDAMRCDAMRCDARWAACVVYSLLFVVFILFSYIDTSP